MSISVVKCSWVKCEVSISVVKCSWVKCGEVVKKLDEVW